MARSNRLPPLSDAQLEIMRVVWDRGEVAVGEVWEALAQKRPIARNTVQTVIARLAQKGWLKLRKQGRAFLYRAAAARDATQRGMVRRLVDTVFSGSAEGLVLAMLEGRGLSREEADRIRKLIDNARENPA
jgi:BlaI family transcriptional regulator, penicillinase repressor